MRRLQVLNGGYLSELTGHKRLGLLVLLQSFKSLERLLHVLVDQEANGHNIFLFRRLNQLKELGLHFL